MVFDVFIVFEFFPEAIISRAQTKNSLKGINLDCREGDQGFASAFHPICLLSRARYGGLVLSWRTMTSEIGIFCILFL